MTTLTPGITQPSKLSRQILKDNSIKAHILINDFKISDHERLIIIAYEDVITGIKNWFNRKSLHKLRMKN